MRVIVTGSRTWTDRQAVALALANLASEHQVLTVVHGACPRGADKIAAQWCDAATDPGLHWGTGGADVTPEPHPADWSSHGKKAGYLRNQAMADLGADLVLAFRRGDSPGTAHMIRCAEKAGIPVKVWTMS